MHMLLCFLISTDHNKIVIKLKSYYLVIFQNTNKYMSSVFKKFFHNNLLSSLNIMEVNRRLKLMIVSFPRLAFGRFGICIKSFQI